MTAYTETAETWTDRDGRTFPVKLSRHDQQPKLVTFGAGGHSVEFSRNCHLFGYDKPETYFNTSRWWTHDFADRQDPEQYEGVPYIDMRAAVKTSAGIRMSISGPMVNVDLPSGAVDRLGEPSDIFAAAMAGNEFGQLLAIQASQRNAGKKYGSLDSVPIDEYLRLWQEAGATVGVIRGGRFVPNVPELTLAALDTEQLALAY